MSTKLAREKPRSPVVADYSGLAGRIGALLEAARRVSVRAVNACMTAMYWEIGRRIVEFEQGGADRAKYGEGLIRRLAKDLGRRGGRGFSPDNLESMRQFYRAFPLAMISETLSRKLGERPADADGRAHAPRPAGNSETLSRTSGGFDVRELTRVFPLPWSA